MQLGRALLLLALVILLLVGVVGCDRPSMTATEVCTYVTGTLPDVVTIHALHYEKEHALWHAQYEGDGWWKVYAYVNLSGVIPIIPWSGEEIDPRETAFWSATRGKCVFPYRFNENTAFLMESPIIGEDLD